MYSEERWVIYQFLKLQRNIFYRINIVINLLIIKYCANYFELYASYLFKFSLYLYFYQSIKKIKNCECGGDLGT